MLLQCSSGEDPSFFFSAYCVYSAPQVMGASENVGAPPTVLISITRTLLLSNQRIS